MTEEEFFSYALYLERERGYKLYWSDTVFRSYFGKWASKKIKQQAEPIQPVEDFILLIDKNIKEWASNNPEEITKFREQEVKKYLNQQKKALSTLKKRQKKESSKSVSEVEELIDLFLN